MLNAVQQYRLVVKHVIKYLLVEYITVRNDVIPDHVHKLIVRLLKKRANAAV